MVLSTQKCNPKFDMVKSECAFEKMKIENALFCIVSISDLGRSGLIRSHFGIFLISQKIKHAGPFSYFFRK